jgi:transposase
MPRNYEIATRASIIALKASGMRTAEVYSLLNIPERTISSIYAKAIARGFDPAERPIAILDKYVEEAPRSGRPSKQTATAQEIVLAKVRTDRYGREKTCVDIAAEIPGISPTTIWRILRKAGLKKTKPTRKPGLTKIMKDRRLAWCLDHKNWTLEQWKDVIWSDETSVVLGHRRGGYRVWRTPDEAYLKSTIRPRWKGYSEFMFWSCFSYDQKDPCHIWKPETKKEKEIAEKRVKEMNQALEPIKKAEWELSSKMERLGLRNKPGQKPMWKFTPKSGKLVRRVGSGIDWYRYQSEIIIPKMIPFAQRCSIERPGTIIQEDGAPSHTHHSQPAVYKLYEICQLLWCGNSPDLSMIEPAWPHLKRVTTRKGAPASRPEGERVWKQAWKDLEQWRIQAWIQRIIRHVAMVIELEGDNN